MEERKVEEEIVGMRLAELLIGLDRILTEAEMVEEKNKERAIKEARKGGERDGAK